MIKPLQVIPVTISVTSEQGIHSYNKFVRIMSQIQRIINTFETVIIYNLDNFMSSTTRGRQLTKQIPLDLKLMLRDGKVFNI